MRRGDEEREQKKRRRGFKWVLAIAGFANKLPWWAAVLLGAGLFAGLYWGVPNWAQDQANQAQDRFYRPLVEAILTPGVPWVQWLGIAVGGACGVLAVKNFFRAKRCQKQEESRSRQRNRPRERKRS